MKRMINIIVTVIMTVSMIVGVNVNAEAKVYPSKIIYNVYTMSEAVALLKPVYEEGYESRIVKVHFDTVNSVWYEYDFDAEEGRYEFTQCRLENERFVDLYHTDYYYV